MCVLLQYIEIPGSFVVIVADHVIVALLLSVTIHLNNEFGDILFLVRSTEDPTTRLLIDQIYSTLFVKFVNIEVNK